VLHTASKLSMRLPANCNISSSGFLDVPHTMFCLHRRSRTLLSYPCSCECNQASLDAHRKLSQHILISSMPTADGLLCASHVPCRASRRCMWVMSAATSWASWAQGNASHSRYG
jgi:hypothetical protein